MMHGHNPTQNLDRQNRAPVIMEQGITLGQVGPVAPASHHPMSHKNTPLEKHDDAPTRMLHHAVIQFQAPPIP